MRGGEAVTRFLLFLGAGLACLAAVSPSPAGYYTPGTVRDGYTFQNGYWYRGNTPHYAHAQTYYQSVPYYNSCGGYYYVQQPYTSYTYEQAYPADTYTPTATAPAASYSKGWQQRLLDIAAARDKVEGELRKNALDQQAYQSAVQALGFM